LLDVPTQQKIDSAFELEKRLLASDPRITTVPMAIYADEWSEVALASTTGITTWQQGNDCVLQTYCLATENGDTQTGFGVSVAREFEELDMDKAVADAARRATQLLGATKPKSRRLPVILDPYVTASFLGVIGFPLTGEAVLKGRSFFANRVGEPVGSAAVTLVSDPTDTRSLAANKMDAEGLASRRVPLIEGGVLNGFVHNSYTARRSGTQSTGSAVRSMKTTPSVGCRALALEEGTQSQAELMQQLGEGVIVRSVSGLHSGVNPVSGDFSTGAEGLRITGGEVGAPLREFTIASTLQRMLLDVGEVGGDVDWLPMRAAGVSLVIHDMTMSGA
jgi:PmbA protein